jgi:hypothetical protein
MRIVFALTAFLALAASVRANEYGSLTSVPDPYLYDQCVTVPSCTVLNSDTIAHANFSVEVYRTYHDITGGFLGQSDDYPGLTPNYIPAGYTATTVIDQDFLFSSWDHADVTVTLWKKNNKLDAVNFIIYSNGGVTDLGHETEMKIGRFPVRDKRPKVPQLPVKK